MKIYFQKGKRAGESMDFNPPGIFIGREEDNDIQLLVEGVSQYHAKIMFEDRKWVIYDLESSNGTRLNGKKVKEPTPLKPGDMIYIAKEALKIEYEEDQEHKKDKAGDILDFDTDEGIKIRSPEDAKKTLPPEEKPKKPTPTKTNMGGIPKKSKEQKALEREHHRLLAEAIKEKKKRLTLIAIIVFFVGNGIVFWWWFSKWLENR